MAPAGPRSPARKRIKTAPGVTLPPDMLFEVFLNLPASSVCRFRAVCRSWRAVLSGRSFLAAHTARRGPLLLAAGPYRSCPRSWHVDLVDLAGTVARRTRTPEAEGGAKELLTCGDLACLVGADDGIARVLDPATGAVTVLPHGLSEENKVAEGWGRRESFHVVAYAFGRVSSTGEYKLLRLVRLLRYTPARGGGLLAEVLTLDGDARWRSRRSPPVIVAADSMVVVDGIVYFLAAQIEQLPFFVNNRVSGQPGSIASFNLETEEWMPIIRGSLNGRRQGNPPELMLQQEPPLLTLAELNGFLVTVHSDRHQLFIHGSMVSDGLQTGNLGEKIQHSA
ncbi:F-box protein At3g07870-like [Panicum virgatum]|uniref:F-box protein At3g07870-like n=1 Tax=Panicum virgatum TaxID=38727 RepID=UPI0019D6A751|nr:F-box protein At3g07870-like [Panicum virgatum]